MSKVHFLTRAGSAERGARAVPALPPEAGRDTAVSLVASRLRQLIHERLGVRVPAEGRLPLGRDLMLSVYGYRINLVDGEQTLLSGQLYAYPVRMEVSHPEVGIDVRFWRPGVWHEEVLAER